MSQDIGRTDFQPGYKQIGPRCSTELNHCATAGDKGRMEDPRQAVGEPLDPQAMELDPGRFSAELSSAGNRDLYFSRSNRRFEIVRIGESLHSVRGHIDLAIIYFGTHVLEGRRRLL